MAPSAITDRGRNHAVNEGTLLFVDYGAAEYQTYTADLCRTFPVSGRFTPEQRKYYDIVLEAQEAAIAAIKPGVMMIDVIKAAAQVFRKHGLEPFEDIERMGEDRVWGIMPSPTHYLARNAGIVRYSAAGFGVRDLNVVAEHDDIVPPESSVVLMDLVGSRKKEQLRFKGGHHGITIGSSAQKLVWPKSAEWLRMR